MKSGVTMVDEGHGVVAVTLATAPGFKVQIAPNYGHGDFMAFASCGGSASRAFCGKYYKSLDGAVRAAEKWLRGRA